jgi:hypothetical protein
MGIRKWFSGKLTNPAWLLGIAVVLAFIHSNISDVDHAIASYLGITDGRFLHPYFELIGYIFVGCGVIALITCFCRYAWIRILRK